MKGAKAKMEVVSKKVNPLLGRREILVKIKCQATPPRHVVRKETASMLGAKTDTVYVIRLNMISGKREALGEIHVYDSQKRALQIEPEYIRLRNEPPKKENVEGEKGEEGGEKAREEGEAGGRERGGAGRGGKGGGGEARGGDQGKAEGEEGKGKEG